MPLNALIPCAAEYQEILAALSHPETVPHDRLPSQELEEVESWCPAGLLRLHRLTLHLVHQTTQQASTQIQQATLSPLTPFPGQE